MCDFVTVVIRKEGPPSESVVQGLTGRGIGIDDFPTRKSARLRLERFWKERVMGDKNKKRGRCAHTPFTIGRAWRAAEGRWCCRRGSCHWE